MVPVAHNSGEFWPKNSFLKYPGTITVVIGKPISYAVGGPEVLMQKCEEWIESRQREIGGKGPFAHKNEIAQGKQPTPPIDG
jgi:1-acyl-sn-glycerol-3-phosphate acyltransferase